MSSASGSAFEPSSVTVWPLTDDAALRDERLGRAARRDAGGGEDFLKTGLHAAMASSRAGLGSLGLVLRSRRLTDLRPETSVHRLVDDAASAGVRLPAPAPARRRLRTAAGVVVTVGSASASGSSKPSASDISSTFGRSVRSLRPNRSRNSRVVAYMNGRPTTCLRPTVLIRWRSTSVDSTPPLLLTPRISAISGRRDRLLVGDHRERLERLHRQLLRRPLVEQLAHPLVQLRARHDLVAAGDLDDLQAARALVVGPQRRERGVDVFLAARRRAACTASSASAARATRRSALRRSASGGRTRGFLAWFARRSRRASFTDHFAGSVIFGVCDRLVRCGSCAATSSACRCSGSSSGLGASAGRARL